MRTIVDLTHPYYDGLEGFPGNMTVQVKPLHNLEDGGYNVRTLQMDGHTGTHLDLPAHVFPGTRTLENLDLSKCVGPACVVRLQKDAGEEISVDDVRPFADCIREKQRVVIQTGWSRHFGRPEFYQDFPGISLDLADWLVQAGVVLLGIEQPSVHPTEGLEVHHRLLQEEVVIVEAVAWPDKIPQEEFDLVCLPLSIRGGDGGPCRVIAVCE